MSAEHINAMEDHHLTALWNIYKLHPNFWLGFSFGCSEGDFCDVKLLLDISRELVRMNDIARGGL